MEKFENLDLYDWFIICVVGQYFLMLPLAFLFRINREVYGFSKVQWYMFWLPMGCYVYQWYLMCKYVIKKMDKEFDNYEK